MTGILDPQAVAETIKRMRGYAQEHYGVPHGPDFPEFARMIEQCDEIHQNAAVHCLLIGMLGGELKEKMGAATNAAADKSNSGAYFRVLMSGTNALQQYVEVLYLGYLLGRQMNEVDMLERIAQPKPSERV